MAEKLYKDSVYRFSDPVRFFKANDPYYFEVDNIPLKQLQENCLWLKDQLTKEVDLLLDVKRGDIQELKPYANGADRVIRVKPGRFTARMNDVAHKQPLQFMQQVVGAELGETNAWAFATNNQGQWPGTSPSYNYLLTTALDKFKSNLAQDALGMTGLAERAFTFPVVDADTPISHGTLSEFMWGVLVTPAGTDQHQGYAFEGNNPVSVSVDPCLLSEGSLWATTVNSAYNHFILETYGTTAGGAWGGAVEQVLLESQFVKKWRGVSRLSIVDVPEEITVTVPPFSQSDFNYLDVDGNDVTVDGIQSRIDLVFIYSKSIDTSAVTINRGTTTASITAPALGIVRGAGIKMSYEAFDNPTNALRPWRHSSVDGEGNLQILASPGDQANSNLGFTAASGNDIAFDVRGSFPAPDDILNIAPIISEKLEDTAFELIGQSILPVAYVWVQSGGSESSDGAAIVDSTDVIDIRPLFRTAELTYAERAGIAAAVPQLSLANPAASKNQVDYEIKRLKDYTDNEIASLTDDNFFEPSQNMCTLSTGYVFGGWWFGPEGVLYDYQKQINNGGEGDPNIKQLVRDIYGYGTGGYTIPDKPDWDQSIWVGEPANALGNQGLYPNDYISTYISQATGENIGGVPMPAAADSTLVAGSFYDNDIAGSNRIRRLGSAGIGKNDNYGGGFENISDATFHYVSKRIPFNRGLAPWLVDYTVTVDFLNCINQTGMGQQFLGEVDRSRTLPAQYTGWWVEKEYDAFTIYVSLVTVNPNGRFNTNSGQNIARYPAPHKTHTEGPLINDRGDVNARFAGFMVPVKDILYSNTSPILNYSNGYEQGYVGNPRIGKCTMPTITWKLTGIPASDADHHWTNLNGPNVPITLRGTT